MALCDMEMAKRIAEKVKDAGGCAYFVGGYVRDLICGETGKDIDIEIHGLTPSALKELLDSLGERLDIGESFGIFGLRGYSLDIAMPRTEKNRGRGHRDFDVFVDPNIGSYKAAMRRDFTINALYMDKNNTIYDYHNGLSDLKEKQIRFIGNTFDRLRQDPLRILRYLRFWGDYAATEPDKAILECFSTLGSGLKNISSGRKKKEMGKILKSNRSSDILRMIDQFNLWPFIAPNSTQKITQLTPKEILTQI